MCTMILKSKSKSDPRDFCPQIISIVARQLVTPARGLKSSQGTPIPRRSIGATRGVAARIGQRSRSVQTPQPQQHSTGVQRNDAKTVMSPFLFISPLPLSRLTGVVVVYISSSPALVVAVIKTRSLCAS